MKKIILIALFFHHVYGDFILSTFLEKINKIKSIEMLYEDKKGNKHIKKVEMNSTLSDDIVVFSETKQDTFLQNIKLKMPTSIKSISIHYIDKDSENKVKLINIDLEDRMIKNNVLYFYEHKKYLYTFDNLHSKNMLPTNKKTKNILKISLPKSKSKFNFKQVDKYDSLKIFYDEDKKYFYLKIQGCEVNGICIEPTYIKDDTNRKAIFKFKFKYNHSQTLENNKFSKFIKRIEVGFHSGNKRNNHLVVESKSKKIINIRQMQLNENKMDNKQLIYRIEFEK